MPFLNSRDGTRLFHHRWPVAPSVERRGQVLLLHGYGEHLARYDHVARPLAEGGFEVQGVDFRGHGKSDGARGFAAHFSEYFDDLEAVRQQMTGGGPLFFVAHSFGALVTLKYILGKPQGIQAIALSSPYLKLKLEVSPVKTFAGNVFSKVWPGLSLANGLRGSDVTHDTELARLYDSDPLNNKGATARWFTEASSAQSEVFTRASEITLPCLMLHGGGDPIADPRRTEEVFARLGSPDKKLEILPRQLHEIFNEVKPDRERTIANVLAWLTTHTSAASDRKPLEGAPVL